MIKILKRENITEDEKVCPIGDILSGEEYFIKPYEAHYGQMKFLPLNAIQYNPWNSLTTLGIDCEEFKREVVYDDFVTAHNIYYRAIPIFLFSENIDKIIDNTKEIRFKNSYKDHEWQVHWYFREHRDENNPLKHDFEINNIGKSLMGHGYSYETSPSDGSVNMKNAIVELSDGSFLGCKVWVWYNK